MIDNLLKYICYPINHDDLTITTAKDGETKILKSSKGLIYSINNGIPNLIPSCETHHNILSKDTLINKSNVPWNEILEQKGISPIQSSKIDALHTLISRNTEKYLNKHLKGNVLEIGSGKNYLKNNFNKKYDNWILSDFNLRSNTIDIQGDGQCLPFKDGVFDCVISIDVLEHVPYPEKMIKEIQRVLKRNGTLILSTPWFFYLHEEPYNFFHFSKFGLNRLMEDNNLRVISNKPIAGVISTFGLLITILITKLFSFSKHILFMFLVMNKYIQCYLFIPLDNLIDKNKKFAQGHIIVSKKI